MQSIQTNRGVNETCPQLLGNARRYLKVLLHAKLPDSVLAAAWDEFYRLYDDLIRRFVVSLGVPRSDVDDCVQEVWMEVAARLVEFERPADRPGLRSWLYTLVRSKATNVFRKKARRRFESLSDRMGLGMEPHDEQPDPETLYERQWRRRYWPARSPGFAKICPAPSPPETKRISASERLSPKTEISSILVRFALLSAIEALPLA